MLRTSHFAALLQKNKTSSQTRRSFFSLSPPRGRRGAPSRRRAPLLHALPPSPPPAQVVGQSPGDAGGGGFSFPTSWRPVGASPSLAAALFGRLQVRRGRVVLVVVTPCDGLCGSVAPATSLALVWAPRAPDGLCGPRWA